MYRQETWQEMGRSATWEVRTEFEILGHGRVAIYVQLFIMSLDRARKQNREWEVRNTFDSDTSS